MIQWSESGFARFAFDLLAMVQGTFRPGYVSSFYGMGSTLTELMQDVGATKFTPD